MKGLVQHFDKSRFEFNPDSTDSRVEILQILQSGDSTVCPLPSVIAQICQQLPLSQQLHICPFKVNTVNIMQIFTSLCIFCIMHVENTVDTIIVHSIFCMFVCIVNCQIYVPTLNTLLHIVDFVQTPNCVTSFLCSPVIQRAATTVHCEQVNKCVH